MPAKVTRTLLNGPTRVDIGDGEMVVLRLDYLVPWLPLSGWTYQIRIYDQLVSPTGGPYTFVAATGVPTSAPAVRKDGTVAVQQYPASPSPLATLSAVGDTYAVTNTVWVTGQYIGDPAGYPPNPDILAHVSLTRTR